MEARTQASVALFKLGAHSATLRPEFGGPKSLRCCCAKGVGHRAQLVLRARRGDRENNHPVPLLRTPTNTTKRSLSPVLTQGGHNYQVPRLAATGRSCHRAQLETLPLNRHPPPPAPAPLLLPRELNRSKRAIASWPRARRSRRRSAHRSRSSPIPPVTCVGRDSMSPPSSPTRTPSTAGGLRRGEGLRLLRWPTAPSSSMGSIRFRSGGAAREAAAGTLGSISGFPLQVARKHGFGGFLASSLQFYECLGTS